MSDPDYPLVVKDSNGKSYARYRDWAQDLAEGDAREIAGISGKRATVWNEQTNQTVFTADP